MALQRQRARHHREGRVELIDFAHSDTLRDFFFCFCRSRKLSRVSTVTDSSVSGDTSDDSGESRHRKDSEARQKRKKRKSASTADDFECDEPDCNHTFATLYFLRKHKAQWHDKVSKTSALEFPCDVPGCDKSFPTQYFFRKHKSLWHEMVTCDICQSTMLKSAIVQHMQTVHRPPAIPCTETNCKRMLASRALLTKHLRWDHRQMECDVCKKSIVAKRFKTHMKLVHLNQELSVCDLCGQICKTLVAYKRHVKTQHSNAAPVQCDLCKAFVKNKTVLDSHMRTVHSDSGPITCHLCGHISPNKKAASSHQIFHKKKEEMRFVCSICGQRFVSKAQLISHGQVHMTIREKLKCSECDKEFTSKSGLKVSRAENCISFECSNFLIICPFYQGHMVLHRPPETFRCPYCPRSYTYESGVRTHILRSHRVENAMYKQAKSQEKLANLMRLNEQQSMESQ